MKRYISCFLTLMLLFSLCACGQPSAPQETEEEYLSVQEPEPVPQEEEPEEEQREELEQEHDPVAEVCALRLRVCRELGNSHLARCYLWAVVGLLTTCDRRKCNQRTCKIFKMYVHIANVLLYRCQSYTGPV